ncbi:MAG: phage repressor protein CI [Corynebacterium sp.]|nr:phage repressor protein CI [Corynebacterium sp.]MDU7865274.1 phage repressor protein CI [Serratia marcescens]
MKYDKGGAAAIDRVVEAYGFRFKNDLCRHIGIASSTLSTWIKADSMPGSLIIQCTLETGVSLEWLVTGEGPKFEHSRSDITTLESYKLIGNQLKKSGKMMFDKVFLPNELREPYVIISDTETFFVDKNYKDQNDGRWLVEIEGNHSIRELAFIPVKKVRVLGGGVPFDCGVDDIKLIARVVAVFSKE